MSFLMTFNPQCRIELDAVSALSGDLSFVNCETRLKNGNTASCFALGQPAPTSGCCVVVMVEEMVFRIARRWFV